MWCMMLPQTLESKIRKIKFDLSGYYFIGLVVLVVAGFWPTYFSKFFDKSADFTMYFHFHAMMLSLWILTLIIQPILIRNSLDPSAFETVALPETDISNLFPFKVSNCLSIIAMHPIESAKPNTSFIIF